MLKNLPQSAESLLQWSWQAIEPYYIELANRSLNARNVNAWLADWSALDERLSEWYARLNLATTQNTVDEKAEQAFKKFLDEIYPEAEAADQKLKEKLLASGLMPRGFALPLKKMRAEADLFRAANLPLLAHEQKLAMEYQKIVGAQTVTWDGGEVTVPQLRPVYLELDRAKRERAWRLAASRQLADREKINDLWRELLALRLQLAQNADQPDFRAYRWQQFLRFDYSPADCLTFHEAIEQAVVPIAQRVYERRRARLGVATLRPWDLDVDVLGRAPLKPVTGIDELKAAGLSIFRRVDKTLGKYFETLVAENLLDLDNRKHKAPGAYCTSFPMTRRPFIFENAVGLHDDLQTLLHESGHAFHDFETYHLPYARQRSVGMEFAEVASMGMELLAAPYLAKQNGGVYSDADAARARIEHLEKSILFWPYMAVVDAFQHWVYTHPQAAMDPQNCDAEWARQWQRFMGGVDYSGLDDEMMTGWHRKLHIHEIPFYYVEYGLAQLGAVQVWGNALKDQTRAVAHYRRALALGGTANLPTLFKTAGAKFAFDAQTLGKAVNLMEQVIEDLESGNSRTSVPMKKPARRMSAKKSPPKKSARAKRAARRKPLTRTTKSKPRQARRKS